MKIKLKETRFILCYRNVSFRGIIIMSETKHYSLINLPRLFLRVRNVNIILMRRPVIVVAQLFFSVHYLFSASLTTSH